MFLGRRQEASGRPPDDLPLPELDKKSYITLPYFSSLLTSTRVLRPGSCLLIGVRLWVEALVDVPPDVQVPRRYQLIGPQLEVSLLEVVELGLYLAI